MLVKEIMTKDVGGLIPESTLKEAAHKMKSLGVGFLPICDGERLAGVITDRDITVRAISKGKDPGTSPVKDFMTPNVNWVFENQDVNKAAAVMKRNLLLLSPVCLPRQLTTGSRIM